MSGTLEDVKPGTAIASVVVAFVILVVGAVTAVALIRSPAPSVSSQTPVQNQVVPWARISVPDVAPTLSGPLASGDVSVELIVDEKGHPGEQLHFVVRLRNDSAQPVSMVECPSYLVAIGKEMGSGMMNCKAGPTAIPSGGHVDYAMEAKVLNVKVDELPMVWQLGSDWDGRLPPSAEANVELDF